MGTKKIKFQDIQPAVVVIVPGKHNLEKKLKKFLYKCVINFHWHWSHISLLTDLEVHKTISLMVFSFY